MRLTKNQKIVLDVLYKSNEPLKAYTILDQTKKEGLKAPTQVYRALDRLIAVSYTHLTLPTKRIV